MACSDCSTTCSGGCSVNCADTCSATCSVSCSNTCSTGCSDACSSVCSSSCSTTCSTGCSDACSSVCSSDCSTECSYTCSTNCADSCSSTCSESCSNTCSTNCSDACSSVCSTNCSTECTTTCSGDCQGGCNTGCNDECSGTCEGSSENSTSIYNSNIALENFVSIAQDEYDAQDWYSNGINKYNEWYYDSSTLNNSAPWCAVFVLYCANKASLELWGTSAYVPTIQDWYTGENRFHFATDGYEPKSGDVVIYDYDDNDIGNHIGIVTSYDSVDGICTIEGNMTSEGILGCRIDSHNSYILGYGEN